MISNFEVTQIQILRCAFLKEDIRKQCKTNSSFNL